MSQIEFRIIIRKPKYPVIVVSAERLYSAYNINQLATFCISVTPVEDRKIIPVVDSTGKEFWYSLEHYALSPGFSRKKWTKKRLIETYNGSTNAKDTNQEYPMKSLSAKRFDKIFRDLCKLLRI